MSSSNPQILFYFCPAAELSSTLDEARDAMYHRTIERRYNP
jgi:hypothetical protein|tara:strand:+ start:408 stop:530 length:123 start_codon:yes stop_codon:yes gene_type:complete